MKRKAKRTFELLLLLYLLILSDNNLYDKKEEKNYSIIKIFLVYIYIIVTINY